MPTRLKQLYYFLLITYTSMYHVSVANAQQKSHQAVIVNPSQHVILSPFERQFSTTCLQLSDKSVRSFFCDVSHLSASVADFLTYRFNSHIYHVSHPSTVFKLSVSDANDPDNKLESYDYNTYGRDAAFARLPAYAFNDITYQCYKSKVIHFCAEIK